MRNCRIAFTLVLTISSACTANSDEQVANVAQPACGAEAGDAQPPPDADAPPRDDAAAPSPPPTSTTVNSIDTIIDDMRLMNDAKLAGVPNGPTWTVGPGVVIMGNDPRGTRTPSWWNPGNTTYKSGAYWEVILPWVVVFDGEGNAATNTRVEMRRLTVYAKSKSRGDWTLVHDPSVIDGENYPKHLQGEDTRAPDMYIANGVTSVRPTGGDQVFHGWGSKRDIEGADIEGVFVTVQARLVAGDATTDDRAQAKYLIHVGADYYPTPTTSVSAFAPAAYLPGVGVSRAKLVTSEWRAFNFATIDVGLEDPGGASMTESAFRAQPPPLE